MPIIVREEIKINEVRYHNKASERYVDATFHYDQGPWETSIPIEYRRTGIDLQTDDEISEYVEKVYKECAPSSWDDWRKAQIAYWESRKAKITYAIFSKLLTFKWTCVQCGLPQNPNFARRVQDIKECGFTLSTNPKKYCIHCKSNNTHLLLLPIKKGGVSGYETWSPELRERIVKLLNSFDVYEAKQVPPHGLLPDHKFPEIRWDHETRRESLEHLDDDDIIRDFQLLNNQRNQQKREVCRSCFQSDTRAYPYGVKYYYKGGESWPPEAPKRGKAAEKGCEGCGWYDFEAWRSAITTQLSKKG